MMTQICMIVEFTIADGQGALFKKLFREALDLTKQKDLGTLSYELYFNHDETKCYSIERYANSDAVLAHQDTVAKVSVPLFEICSTTRFEIFGDPSPKLQKALEASSPNRYKPWEGFARI
jgi:quinol monooxygenase YgiN